MAAEQTQHTMERYFELMGDGADFGECYADEVTWIVAETGQVMRGPAAVREYVVAVHATMADARTRKYVLGEDYVYLEGDCAPTDAGDVGRTRYCVAYDLTAGVITAMRCYGLGDRSVA